MKHAATKLIRFAVVGLGHFAQTAILPAFKDVKHAKLHALVTSDPEKAAKLSRKYRATAYPYEDFGRLCRSREIDAVYIAVPNSEHRRYVVQAAGAGIHVLCEKPLAYSVTDAKAMVTACERGGVRLMTAYRLHFEEGNLQAIKALRVGAIGEPRLFVSVHTMQVEPDNIRVDLSLGGGPLEDIGIYCLNAARYLFQAEPQEVMAYAVYGDDPRFREVPEAVSCILRFPQDRLASFLCGFGETKISEYRVIGAKGLLEMNPAYTWNEDLKQKITVEGQVKAKQTYKHRGQVAAEISYFCKCLADGTEPEPSGREGLLDVMIMEALRRSYQRGKAVQLRLPSEPRPKPAQSIKRKAAKKPKPVKASPPSRE